MDSCDSTKTCAFIFDGFDGANSLKVPGHMLEHLVHLFGLVKLARKSNESEVDFEPTAVPKFTLSQVEPGQWRAEFPRGALVAIGTKPLKRKKHPITGRWGVTALALHFRNAAKTRTMLVTNIRLKKVAVMSFLISPIEDERRFKQRETP